MSVPLHDGDVDTLQAFLGLRFMPPRGLDPDGVSLVGGAIRITCGSHAPQAVLEALTPLGYTANCTDSEVLITGRKEPGPDDPQDPVAAERAQLDRLHRLRELPHAELRDDPYTTDDRPVERLRGKLRRRKLQDQLRDRRAEQVTTRRQRARQERRQRREEHARQRAERRTQAIQRRAQHRRDRVAARHAQWEHAIELAGKRELLKRQAAKTPERMAAVLARLQAGVLIVATLSIIGLGSASTAAVHAFMVKFASAAESVAWGVEPAIIMLVVGVNIARYVLSQNGGRVPGLVTAAEYLAMSASVTMAGLGAGQGAIVAPLGVVIVSAVATKLTQAIADADPESVQDTGQDSGAVPEPVVSGVPKRDKPVSRTPARVSRARKADTAVSAVPDKQDKAPTVRDSKPAVPAGQVPTAKRVSADVPDSRDTDVRPGQSQDMDTGHSDIAVPQEWVELLGDTSSTAEAVRVLRDEGAPKETVVDFLVETYQDWSRDTVRRTANRIYSQN